MFRALARVTLLVSASLLLLLPAFAQDSVSLGEVARQNRARSAKKHEKVITNEDLAPVNYNNGAIQGASFNTTPKSGDSGKSADSKQEKNNSTEAEKAKDKASNATKNGETDAKSDKTADAKSGSSDDRFRAEYAAKKSELAMLQRELNVKQQEYALQTTKYYADAGTALRDPQAWASSRKDYEDQIAEKQKQIQEATQALEDLQEQGRKAGASASIFE
jgi:hypothetical protein